MVSVFLLLSLLSSLVSRKVKGNSLLPAPEKNLWKMLLVRILYMKLFLLYLPISLFFIVFHLIFVCVHLIIWGLLLNVWGTLMVSFEEDRGMSREKKMYLHNKRQSSFQASILQVVGEMTEQLNLSCSYKKP